MHRRLHYYYIIILLYAQDFASTTKFQAERCFCTAYHIFAFPPPLCRGQDTRKRRMDLHFFNRRVSVVPSAYYHGHRCIYPRPPVVASVRAPLRESCPCGLPERSIVTISSPSPERECSYVVPGSPHIEASFIRVYLTR